MILSIPLGGRLALAAMIAIAGCIGPRTVQCGDITCPVGTVCIAELGACAAPENITACDGLADDTECTTAARTPGVCRAGVCIAPLCGDGLTISPEQCDGADIGSQTCLDLGFYSEGSLACKSDCTFDTSGCFGFCGDGEINAIESCDGDNVAGLDCTGAGFYDPGPLSCSNFCTFDTRACTGFCGDGVTNGPELCDGPPPTSPSCYDLGFDIGAVDCSPACAVDLEPCQHIGLFQEFSSLTGGGTLGLWGTGGVLFSLAAPGGELLQRSGVAWSIVATAGITLLDLWGDSPTSLFAVGRSGEIRFYDGASFAVMVSPTSEDLTAVSGTSASDVFAVGEAGTILHFDGSSWSAMSSGVTEVLWDVWAVAPNSVYAVGDAGTVLHYDGAGWSPVSEVTSSKRLRSIWANGPQQIFVVGDGELWHFDGSWRRESPPPGNQFYAVIATEAGNPIVLSDQDWTTTFVRGEDGWTALADNEYHLLLHLWYGNRNLFVAGLNFIGLAPLLHHQGPVGRLPAASGSFQTEDVALVGDGRVIRIGSNGSAQADT